MPIIFGTGISLSRSQGCNLKLFDGDRLSWLPTTLTMGLCRESYAERLKVYITQTTLIWKQECDVSLMLFVIPFRILWGPRRLTSGTLILILLSNLDSFLLYSHWIILLFGDSLCKTWPARS